MSIELRRRTRGECDCGIAKYPGEPRSCEHWWECDWGRIENPQLDTRYPTPHLMLTTVGFVKFLQGGPGYMRGGLVSVSDQDGRSYFHLDHSGQRWTWELFEAHFVDGVARPGFLLGRWPD